MHRHLIHFTMVTVLLLGLLMSWLKWSSLPEQPTQPCFYFWKTAMDFDSTEWRRFTRLSGQQPLYLRMFDVDYSAGYGNAVPLGDVDQVGNNHPSDGRPIIPTVYITNRVFERLSEAQVNVLAQKIHLRILHKLERWKEEQMGWQLLPFQEKTQEADRHRRDSLSTDWILRCDEIQLDCDWTPKTRDRYFQFLRAFHTQAAPRRVSCTVRLHQFRDRKQAGIPPVDRGMLMCYNVADPKRADTPNAIFDPRLIKGYLQAPSYPLPLDVALPIFSWGAWFREDNFQGLLTEWNQTDVSPSALYQPEGASRYRVLQDTVINQNYLREGDIVRLDQPSEADLLAVTDLLRKKVRGRDSRLVFFDWQNEKIARYEKIIAACAAHFK